MYPQLPSENTLWRTRPVTQLSAAPAASSLLPMRRGTRASNFFSKIARRLSRALGQPLTFVIVLLIVIVWATMGPLFHFSDTWQLVINTCSSVVTFLMVFLIQNTQNSDSDAI